MQTIGLLRSGGLGIQNVFGGIGHRVQCSKFAYIHIKTSVAIIMNLLIYGQRIYYLMCRKCTIFRSEIFQFLDLRFVLALEPKVFEQKGSFLGINLQSMP